MNEAFTVRLVQDSRVLPVLQIADEGVILDQEVDASARPVRLEFIAANATTEAAMRNVRQRFGWNSRTFNLEAFRKQETLGFRGVASDALPPGHYKLRLTIGDLKLPGALLPVTLRAGEESSFDVPVEADRRTIRLRDAALWDADVRRVLEGPSTLDGKRLIDWLQDPTRRPSRKACLLNVVAKLRQARGLGDTLLSQVRQLFFADSDRIYAVVTRTFLGQLRDLTGQQLFLSAGAPRAAVHRRLLDKARLRGLGDVDGYQLLSFRQAGPRGLQAVVAVPPDPAGDAPYFADLDVDLGNPLEDVRGFSVHTIELLDPARTDHLALHAHLRLPPVGEFLHYDVV